MAGNIAGMFNQINSAVQANPLGGEMGQGLLNTASQGAGNMMGAALGQEGTDFMSPQAKEMQIEQDAQETSQQAFTSNDPQTMEMAAQKLDAMGKYEEAARLRERAGAINAKNNAQLEAANEGIQEEVKRKKDSALKTQALAMAQRRGDLEAAQAIMAGALSGEDYLRTTASEKPRHKIVSQGQAIVDEDEGTVIYEHPDPDSVPGSNFKLTGPDKVAMNKAQENWQLHSQRATMAKSTADQIAAMSANTFNAGAYATVDEMINGITGTRDKASQLRTQYLNVQKSGIVQAMPSGPQSDNDVKIFSRGFPPENAGKEEVVAFLEAQARMAQYAADYEEMRVDYIGTGRQKDFIPAWKRKMAAEGRQENINATPPAAIEALKKDPSLKDLFQAKYNWLPEGI